MSSVLTLRPFCRSSRACRSRWGGRRQSGRGTLRRAAGRPPPLRSRGCIGEIFKHNAVSADLAAIEKWKVELPAFTLFNYVGILLYVQGDHGGLRLDFVDFNIGAPLVTHFFHAISAQFSPAQAESGRRRNKHNPSQRNLVSHQWHHHGHPVRTNYTFPSIISGWTNLLCQPDVRLYLDGGYFILFKLFRRRQILGSSEID